MKKALPNCLLLLALFCAATCVSNPSQKTKTAIEHWMETVKPMGDYEALVIIPGAGCQGCITKARKFALQNCGKSKAVGYVFTEIPSQKIMKVRLSGHGSCENIMVDKGNRLGYGLLKNAIYPCIVHLKKGKVTSIVFISPDNQDVLAGLKKSMSSDDAQK